MPVTSFIANSEMPVWRSMLEDKRIELMRMEGEDRRTIEELTSEQTGEISKVRLHPADLASDTRLTEVVARLSAKDLTELQAIEAALARIDRGTFGICVNCGDAIARERLAALPEAKYCVECETDIEAANRLSKEMRLAGEGFWADRLCVSDVMSERPLAVRADEGVDAAVELMWRYNVRHLPVVDDQGDVQGVVSDRDIIQASTGGGRRVREVMTKTPDVVSPDMTLGEAAMLLVDNRFSCLPVVEGNKLVGILTETDFVKLIARSEMH